MNIMKKKLTFGLIVGTRRFFNPKLAQEGRRQLLAKLKSLGYSCAVLPQSATANGVVETLSDARKCAELFKQNLDKIDGILRSETPDMPFRQVRNFDVMAYGYRDDSDSYTAQHPDLPEQLDLWEEIICCGRFFNPNGVVGGFTYVEIYDPEYWMERNYVTSQSCFHPMYRMRSKNSLSVLDHTTVAFWLTKYADIVPAVESGLAVAAPSFHFGFPLWFFDRDEVDQIVEVFFTKWQILSTP